jgi:hypothetical protein
LTNLDIRETARSETTIFWLHFTSCLTGLSFAAASPYVYVFRSEKVQKCLRQLLLDLLCCCSQDLAPELTSKLASRAGSISCVQVELKFSKFLCKSHLFITFLLSIFFWRGLYFSLWIRPNCASLNTNKGR